MSIIGADPLAFLTSQGGLVGAPLAKGAAEGSSPLDSQQRAAVIGEVIPIVFGRRVGGVGGVLVSPPATEARFEDAANGDVTASYHLVLSEGRIDPIQVRDVFQRSCRVGSFTQTYDRRAGTFVPGNFIDNSPNLEAPYYCGTGGSYAGLSTMAFEATTPAGFDYWNRQVHCFVRGGIWVPRLLDNITGPSNNVVDLLLYLLRSSSRVPETLIDTANFLAAATFTDVNQFWFNGAIQKSNNLRDWASNTLKYFLLRHTRVNGKEALKPLLPVNANGTIKTTPVSWEFTFTEKHIVPEGFEIVYTPLADRKFFCVSVLWRQQDDLGIPLMRTAEVRYSGTAVDGPYEQHDLSEFCSSEDHAVKAGAYILSKRHHVSHRLSITVKPDSFNPTLTAGDLVRVKIDRVPSSGPSSVHDYLYEVERIGKSLSGPIQLDLIHFPVDSQLCSVIAKEVSAAVGTGVIISNTLAGVSCDINSSSDSSVPGESFSEGPSYELDYEMDDLGDMEDDSLEDAAGGDEDNPADGLDTQSPELSDNGTPDSPHTPPWTGEPMSTPTTCEGGETIWYRTDPSAPGGKVQVGTGSTYTPSASDEGKSITSETRCPDPTSPDGLGDPKVSNPTRPVVPVPDLPNANVNGTYSPTASTSLQIYAQWEGQRLISGTCTIQETSVVFGTATVIGVTGFRTVYGPVSGLGCGGYASMALQVRNAAGVWTQIASITGGSTGWYYFSGTITMSSTAPDAIPAYLGNFGGTSNP